MARPRKCGNCGGKVIDSTGGGKWFQVCAANCGWIWMEE